MPRGSSEVLRSLSQLRLHCDHRHREPIVDREKMLAMVRGSADSLAFASEDLPLRCEDTGSEPMKRDGQMGVPNTMQ